VKKALSIQRTLNGNYTINGRLYANFDDADLERRRLNLLIQRAKERKKIIRDLERELHIATQR
jgi:hypothetical protein